MTYAELQVLLTKVANVINDRPIGVQYLTEDEMVPLTVNQLLLGRTSSAPPSETVTTPGNPRDRKRYLENLTQVWWNLWKEQVFPLLLPYSKFEDTQRHRNLQVGDICLIKYETKVAATYRLCKIVRVFLSDGGVVRTVEVLLGNGKATKKAQPGKLLTTAVQRLVLLVPVKEGPEEEEEQLQGTEVNVINWIQEDSQQEEHCYGLNDREVNCHSWSPTPPAPPAPNGSYLPLIVSSPMCGNRLSRERTLQLNPKAPEYRPSSLDVGHWASSGQLSSQLPAVWASTTWVDGAQFLGIGPLPSPGFGPTIPLFGPSPGGPANPGWLPIY